MPQYTKNILEEELKKAKESSPGWSWRLFIFTSFIFGIIIIVYLGMSWGYKSYLNSQIKDLDAKIADLGRTIDEGQQKKLVTAYSQLVNIQSLLNSHLVPSKFFDFLERNTHPQIYYLVLNLSLIERSIRLEGVSSNYAVLVQQLELFQRASEIESVLLGNSRVLENDNVQFSLRLVFKPELVR